MEELKFRTLTADEIECRVSQTGKNSKGSYWCTLLLYKDARCDQRLLDETVGCFRWKRSHELINGNLFCTVSIKDESGEWVSKQDVGTESNTEKEKGQASDAFKRACFNWGLGRELYTSPKIFVNLTNDEVYEAQGKVKVSPYVSFKVSSINYDAKRNITSVVIVDNQGHERYSYGSKKTQTRTIQKTADSKPQPQPQTKQLQELTKEQALEAIQKATTKEELVGMFNGCKHLQADGEFLNALTSRKNEILSSHGTAAA